jgi:hypothetical protein
MASDEVSQKDLKQIQTINRLLETRFGLRLEAGPVSHFEMVLKHYEDKRRMYINHFGETQALDLPDYAKAVLISEGIRLVLREIAPKRRKRSKRKN